MKVKENLFEYIRVRFGDIPYIKSREFYNRTIGRLRAEQIDLVDDGFTIQRGRGRKYLVSRFAFPEFGIASVMIRVLMASVFADKYGYGLTVYYSVKNAMTNNSRFGGTKDNIWERYFEPINPAESVISGGVTGEVIALPLGTVGVYERNFFETINPELNSNHNKAVTWKLKSIDGKEGKEYRDIFRAQGRRYLTLNAEFLHKVEMAKREVFTDDFMSAQTLGVFMREHFTKENKENIITNPLHKVVLASHGTVISTDECIEQVKKKYDLWGCKYIFVSTLYEDTLKKFREIFGRENVLCTNRSRSRDLRDYIFKDIPYEELTTRAEWDDRNKELTDSYMIEMMLLSKCNWFISQTCGGGGFIVPILKGEEFADTYYCRISEYD